MSGQTEGCSDEPCCDGCYVLGCWVVRDYSAARGVVGATTGGTNE